MQHLVGAVLVELAAPHLLVLDEQPLRSGKRHRDDVLGHRLSPAAPVGGDGQLRRQPARRHPINPGGCELQQPRVADQWDRAAAALSPPAPSTNATSTFTANGDLAQAKVDCRRPTILVRYPGMSA